MKCRRAAWALGIAVLAGIASAGEGSVDDLVKEFLGQTPAVERTPRQLVAAYAAVIDSLLPGMASENPPDRQRSEQTLQEICWRAGRPGADAERLAVCEVMAAKLGAALPKMTAVWLTKQIEHIGRAESVAVLAKRLGNEEPLIRECARRALQNNPAPEATAKLVGSLAVAKDPKWRVALINAIGCRRDPAALQPLIQQAGDADDSVRIAASLALGQLGEKAAADALAAAMAKGSDKAKAMATDGYLLLAGRLVAKGDKASALPMYRKLLDGKGHIRCAAIIGIGRAGGLKELDTIFAALADPDEKVRGAGLQALGLLPASEVTQAIIEKMKTASPEMKVALLRALAAGGDKDALPAFLAAAKDPAEDVRLAAYEGMGELRNPEAAAVLIGVVAAKTGKELDGAKAALDRIPGDEVGAAIAKAVAGAEPGGRVQLLQCLAARRAPDAAVTLLKSAQDPDASVRAEALRLLAEVGDEKAVPDVVKLLVNAKEDRERQAAERTLVVLARKIDDPDQRAEAVLAALAGASVPARVALIRALGPLGGQKALDAVRAAMKDASLEVQDAAFRALPNWADQSVANDLLAIAKEDANLARRVLALRGAVDVASRLGGLSPDEVLKLYETAMAAAPRPEDKKMVLGGMGSVGNLGALKLAQKYLDDPTLKAEAEVAVAQIARGISGSYQAVAREACQKLIATSKNERVIRDAKDTIDLIERFEDYVTAWEVSGPYEQGEKDGPGLFDVAFPPEKPLVGGVSTPREQQAKWRTMPIGTDKGRPWLIEFDKTPGIQGSNRAVYLRTRVYSPKAQEAQLEAGSDDGIKAWVNGKLVASNNSSRPVSPGSDKAKVALKEGWNDVMLKITQGGGEWSACLRFRAAGGGKLDGLRADPAGK